MGDLFRLLQQRWCRRLARGLAQLMAKPGIVFLTVIAVGCAGAQPTISAPAAQSPADPSSKYCETGSGTGVVPILKMMSEPPPASAQALSAIQQKQLLQIEHALGLARKPTNRFACFGSIAIAGVANQCMEAVRSAAKAKAKSPFKVIGPEFLLRRVTTDASGRIAGGRYELKAVSGINDKGLVKRNVAVSISYGTDIIHPLGNRYTWLISRVSC